MLASKMLLLWPEKEARVASTKGLGCCKNFLEDQIFNLLRPICSIPLLHCATYRKPLSARRRSAGEVECKGPRHPESYIQGPGFRRRRASATDLHRLPRYLLRVQIASGWSTSERAEQLALLTRSRHLIGSIALLV